MYSVIILVFMLPAFPLLIYGFIVISPLCCFPLQAAWSRQQSWVFFPFALRVGWFIPQPFAVICVRKDHGSGTLQLQTITHSIKY